MYGVPHPAPALLPGAQDGLPGQQCRRTELRGFFEGYGQGCALRVPSNFRLTLTGGKGLTCADAVSGLLAGKHPEVRSAGKGAKGERWYTWSWLATASPQYSLLMAMPVILARLVYSDVTDLAGGMPCAST